MVYIGHIQRLIAQYSCVCAVQFITLQTSSRAVNISHKAPRNSVGGTFRPLYPPRATRRSSAPIKRDHHWGFKSLRPAAPLMTQQLLALKEVGLHIRVCVISTHGVCLHAERQQESEVSQEVHLPS